MDDIEIRPTLKFVYAAAIVVGIIVLGVWIVFLLGIANIPVWVPAATSLLLLWPFAHWVRIRTSLTVLTGDRLRWQWGILSKSSRNLMLSRIQDIGVDQSLSQRIFNVGSIWIETAGASSRVLLHDVDAPQRLADEILERSRGAV